MLQSNRSKGPLISVRRCSSGKHRVNEVSKDLPVVAHLVYIVPVPDLLEIDMRS